MATGLEDWTLSTTPTVITATKLDNGLDADKAAAPAAGAVYYARDTKILYLCAAAGTWTGIDAASIVEGIFTLYADLAGGGFEITNIADPTAAQSAATRAYILAQLANYLALAGGTMAGAIAMGTNKITGLAAPTAAADAARKSEVDTVDAKLDDTAQAAPARSMNTIYQNTSGKIRHVTVSAYCAGTNYCDLVAYCATASTPTTIIGRVSDQGLTASWISTSFEVPPSYYYRVVENGDVVSAQYWFEWDEH